MKSKYLIAILLAAMMTTPVFAFWHPPHEEPPCPWFGVMINGEWGTPTEP
jgi:hypothetical protein